MASIFPGTPTPIRKFGVSPKCHLLLLLVARLDCTPLDRWDAPSSRPSPTGRTALMDAAASGLHRICGSLLDARVEVNHADQNGHSPTQQYIDTPPLHTSVHEHT